jgi:hypothetical protein
VWAVAGVALAATPGFVLNTVFDQPALSEDAWIRLVGVQSFGLAMLMVLVAHRLEDLWWWSWAFALATLATAAVVALNAAFGLEPGQSGLLWWLFSLVAIGFALWLLTGLYVTSQENPLP